MEGKIYPIKKIKELIRISGVYKIWFTTTKNFYIGSSKDIGDRLNHHRRRLERGIHENLCLINAVKKHGLDNCFVEVMKVCHPDERFTHEQHFIDTLKPKYNIKKLVTSGAETKLNTEDILSIRKDFYSREGYGNLDKLAEKYNISVPYILKIAKRKRFVDIPNTPEIEELIGIYNDKLYYKANSVCNEGFMISPTRKLNAEQVGMIRWAIANDKSAIILCRHLGIDAAGGRTIRSIRNGASYKEYQDLVDASHFNLPTPQKKKLSVEDVPKIRWAIQQGEILKDIAYVFGCSITTIYDIKMSRTHKTITAIEPCEHLFNQ